MAKQLVTVVSHLRSENVERMWALGLPTDALWFVRHGERVRYGQAGVKTVGVDGLSVTDSRQAVLQYAWHHKFDSVVMLDDDLRKLQHFDPAKGVKEPIDIPDALRYMNKVMWENNLTYVGVGPTDNAYFVKKPVHFDKYVRSAFVVVKRTDPAIWYDPRFKVKEDYDFSAQHLERFGRIGRVDAILASFSYKTNGGGCQEYRTREVEQQAIALLLEKWPNAVRLNSRRQDEVLFKWR